MYVTFDVTLSSHVTFHARAQVAVINSGACTKVARVEAALVSICSRKRTKTRGNI